MKVLHISGSTVWGGNEQQIINLIPEMNKLGIKNVVLLKKDSYLEVECIKNKIEYIQTTKTRKNKITIYKYFNELLNEIKPDIIHFHTSDFLTIYVITSIIYNLKIPGIYVRKSIVNSGSVVSKFRYNFKNIKSLICVSEKVKDNMKQLVYAKNHNRLKVIYDCISLSKMSEIHEINLREKFLIDKNKFLIGNIANHNKAKDIETLINTADFLVNELKINSVMFIQIGEFSNLTESFQKLIKLKKIENNFIFTDKIYKAYLLNKQLDCFIMTSEREGGPTSVLEALYTEIPVVSTDVGIVSEIIKNGDNGFISEVKDFKSLALNLQLLIMDNNLRNEIVKNNKKMIINTNSAEKIALKTVEIYKSIL